MKDEVVAYEYGASPDILVTLWNLLHPHVKSTSEPQHMLWWLYNCKHYPTKQLFEKAMRVSSPTARKHMKPFKLAFLKIRNSIVRKSISPELAFFKYSLTLFFLDSIQRQIKI